jgi:hypothetical protein
MKFLEAQDPLFSNEGNIIYGFMPDVPANTPAPTVEILTQWHLLDYQPIQSTEVIPSGVLPNTLIWSANNNSTNYVFPAWSGNYGTNSYIWSNANTLYDQLNTVTFSVTSQYLNNTITGFTFTTNLAISALPPTAHGLSNVVQYSLDGVNFFPWTVVQQANLV